MPANACSRRRFLRWTLTAGAGALAACAGRAADPTGIAPPATVSTSSTPALASTATTPPTASPTPVPPTPTIVPSPPASATAPATVRDRIQNVVIFIQENHTFDSLFAGFPGADGVDSGQPCPDALPADPPHQHADALRATSNTTAAARCTYTEAMAPNYWKLARAFTLCDSYFTDVRGPSHPNF